MQEKIIEELRQELKEQIEENKELEKKVDGLVTIIDLIKEYTQELRWFDNESVEFEISNKLLEILERVNESEVN